MCGLSWMTPVLVKPVIGSVSVLFIPPRGHLVPQSEAHREFGAELDFILNVPGGLRGAVVQFRRIRLETKRGRLILEKGQQRGIADGSRILLSRGDFSMLDPR